MSGCEREYGRKKHTGLAMLLKPPEGERDSKVGCQACSAVKPASDGDAVLLSMHSRIRD